jgi:type VI protein secretion system component VasK
MNTISSLNNSNAYIPQTTNKVAVESSTNPANNAANQSAFSSYISEALAQIGVANPTSIPAPVVSGTSETSSPEQSLSSFVKNLFSILSQKTSEQSPTVVDSAIAKQGQTNFQQISSQDNEGSERSADNETAETGGSINNEAVAAYTGQNSTTVGNLATNLQSLIKQLNDQSQNTDANNSSSIQALKDSFQSILDAQGAGTNSSSTLGNFLQTLAQNLQGESPLGIVINTIA